MKTTKERNIREQRIRVGVDWEWEKEEWCIEQEGGKVRADTREKGAVEEREEAE